MQRVYTSNRVEEASVIKTFAFRSITKTSVNMFRNCDEKIFPHLVENREYHVPKSI